MPAATAGKHLARYLRRPRRCRASGRLSRTRVTDATRNLRLAPSWAHLLAPTAIDHQPPPPTRSSLVADYPVHHHRALAHYKNLPLIRSSHRPLYRRRMRALCCDKPALTNSARPSSQPHRSTPATSSRIPRTFGATATRRAAGLVRRLASRADRQRPFTVPDRLLAVEPARETATLGRPR